MFPMGPKCFFTYLYQHIKKYKQQMVNACEPLINTSKENVLL